MRRGRAATFVAYAIALVATRLTRLRSAGGYVDETVLSGKRYLAVLLPLGVAQFFTNESSTFSSAKGTSRRLENEE